MGIKTLTAVVGKMVEHIPTPLPPTPNGSTTDPNGDGWRMDEYRAGKVKRVEDGVETSGDCVEVKMRVSRWYRGIRVGQNGW